jgi:hypothetical protein
MTDRSIRLLALAILCGCSLISLTIGAHEKELFSFLTFAVSGVWFIGYWFFIATRKRN